MKGFKLIVPIKKILKLFSKQIRNQWSIYDQFMIIVELNETSVLYD